jgi:hypothetical protein
MKFKFLALSLGLAATLTGCSTTEHVMVGGKCVTCINNPLTGEPLNHDGSIPGSTYKPSDKATAQSDSSGSAGSSSGRKTFTESTTSFSVPVNVDVAFIRIKKEYEYQSEQEIRQEWGSLAETKMKTFAWAYDSEPSVYYRMRAHRQHGDALYVIDHNITKQNADASEITITVWVNDQSPISPADVAKSLAGRTKTALKI